MNKNRWMYTVQFNEVEQRWQLRRIDREEAYWFGACGHGIAALAPDVSPLPGMRFRHSTQRKRHPASYPASAA